MPGDAGSVQLDPQSIVINVAEPLAKPLDLLDERSRTLGGGIVLAVAVVVGQPLGFPAADGAPQPVTFGDCGGVGGVVEVGQRLTAAVSLPARWTERSCSLTMWA